MSNILPGIFDFGKKARMIDALQNNLSALSVQNDLLQQQLAVSFRRAGGFAKYDYNNKIGYITNGYNISAAVYSIVSDIAAKAASIPIRVYKVVDDVDLKNYKGLKSLPRTPENVYRLHKMRKKALQEVDEDDSLQRLIDNPNELDEKSNFYQVAIGYRLLTGDNFIYAPTLDMGANKGRVAKMYIMPSQYTALIVTKSYPATVLGYQLIIDGVNLITSADVLHTKYPNYYATIDHQELYGWSPLASAARTLQRANDSEQSAMSQLQNNGPSVIIANKNMSADDMSAETVGALKKQWKSEYSGSSNRAKVKLMAGDISAIPLGISPVELDLIKGEQWSFDQLCNIYKVSSVMFNNHDGNTESNVKEMRKDSYTRAILPETQALVNLFNKNLVPKFNGKGVKYFVDMDISGIPELQPDMQTMSTWLGLAWWVSPNEKREMMDFDQNPDPDMDRLWIPNTLVPMDEQSLNAEDLPSAGNDFNRDDSGQNNGSPDDDSENDNQDEPDSATTNSN